FYRWSPDLPAFIRLPEFAIELKRDGQYVIAPGSIHPSGHVYAEVTPWPVTLDALPELPEFVRAMRDTPAPTVPLSPRPWFVTGLTGTEHLTAHTPAFQVPDQIFQNERHRTIFKLVRSRKLRGYSVEDTLI